MKIGCADDRTCMCLASCTMSAEKSMQNLKYLLVTTVGLMGQLQCFLMRPFWHFDIGIFFSDCKKEVVTFQQACKRLMRGQRKLAFT